VKEWHGWTLFVAGVIVIMFVVWNGVWAVNDDKWDQIDNGQQCYVHMFRNRHFLPPLSADKPVRTTYCREAR